MYSVGNGTFMWNVKCLPFLEDCQQVGLQNVAKTYTQLPFTVLTIYIVVKPQIVVQQTISSYGPI